MTVLAQSGASGLLADGSGVASSRLAGGSGVTGGGGGSSATADVTLSTAATGFPSITAAVSGGTATAYQWQERTRSGGGAWSNAAGTGNATATYSGVQDLKEYRCACTVAGSPVYTPTVMAFGYTGAAVDFTTDAAYAVGCDLYGAKGADTGSANEIGGAGGRLQQSIDVAAGASVRMTVGQQGATSTSNTGAFGGGGAKDPGFSYTYFQGGGATDIRIGGTALTDRKGVAGGGGGAGNHSGSDPQGGDGGATTAEDGDQGGSGGSLCVQGRGGTAVAGGAAGSSSSYPSTAGTSGVGGRAGSSLWGSAGSGGGGLFGGGGGGTNSAGPFGAGGGGGSNGAGQTATGVTHTRGVRTSDGVAMLILRPAGSGPAATPTFVGASDFQGSATGSATSTVTLPALVAVGDRLVAIVSVANNTAPAAAPAPDGAGWTEIGTALECAGQLVRRRLFVKTYASGTTESITNAGSPNGAPHLLVLVFRGTSGVTVAASGTRVSASPSNTIPLTDLAAPLARLLLAICCARTSLSATIATAADLTFEATSALAYAGGTGTASQRWRIDFTSDLDISTDDDVTINVGDNTEAVGWCMFVQP